MAFGRKQQEPAAAPTPAPESAPDAAATPPAETTSTPAPAETAPPVAQAAPAPARRSIRSPAGGDQLAMRLVATAGIVGIGVAIGAILVGQNVAGWITGLVVSLAAMVLMAVVWGPRRG